MDEKPIKPVVASLLENLQKEPAMLKRTKLEDIWPQVAGSFFSQHSKARFTANKKVIVFVADGTMAFEMRQRYRTTILKRLQNQFGAEEIEDVIFRVGAIKP